MQWFKRVILATMLCLATLAVAVAPARASAVPAAADPTVFPSAWRWEIERWALEAGSYESQVSVDGHYLGVATHHSVWLLNLWSGRTTEIYSAKDGRVDAPKVSEHHVVWASQEHREGPWHVYVFDLRDGTTVKLPRAGRDFDVYDGDVVWATKDGVYLYEAKTGESTLVVPAEDVSEPQISFGSVVWRALTNPGASDWDSAEIFLYDRWSEEVRQLTSDSLFDRAPKIGGHYVVWERGRSDDLDTTEICLYSLFTGMTTQITDDSECDTEPRIMDDNVVWTKLGHAPTDDRTICLYDTRAKRTTSLTSNRLVDGWPSVSGNLVAWSGGHAVGGGTHDLYVYDATTERVTMVSRSSVGVLAPVIDDGRLFWLEHEGGEGYAVFRATHICSLSDVDRTNTDYWDCIQATTGRGIMSGFPDGTFRPEAPVTRQQFAKMIAKATGIAVSMEDVCPFPDVAPNQDETDPFYPDRYVGAASKAGLIQGYIDGTFGPADSITRAQVVSMVVRAAEKLNPGLLQIPLRAFRSDWGDFDAFHAANARKADYNGLLSRLCDQQSNPFAPMTRGEVACVLDSYLNLVRKGPIPSLQPGDPSVEEMAALILADHPHVPKETFGIVYYRVLGDWAAIVLIHWKQYQGANVVLGRAGGQWHLVSIGTGEDPGYFQALGVPAELVDFLL